MGKEDDMADIRALLSAADAEPTPELPTSEFAQQVGAALSQALTALRAEGAIEVEDARFDSLVAEVTAAGLEANSPKSLVKRVIKTLMSSEDVEEVFSSDDEIGATVTRFLSTD